MKHLYFTVFIFFVATSTKATTPPPLTEAQKLDTWHAIKSMHRLDRVISASIYTPDPPPADIKDLVEIFRACESKHEDFGDHHNGGWIVDLTGPNCKVSYYRKTEWRSKMIDGEMRWYAVDDNATYSTEAEEVLRGIDIPKMQSDYTVRHYEPRPIQRRFTFENLLLGKVTGHDYEFPTSLSDQKVDFTTARDLTIADLQVEARLIRHFKDEKDKKPVLIGEDYFLNGETVSESDLHKVYPQ